MWNKEQKVGKTTNVGLANLVGKYFEVVSSDRRHVHAEIGTAVGQRMKHESIQLDSTELRLSAALSVGKEQLTQCQRKRK